MRYQGEIARSCYAPRVDDQQRPVRDELPETDGDVLIEFADEEPSAPSRPRRKRVLLTAGVVALCGLIAASITLGPTALRILDQKNATLTPTPQAAGLVLDETPQAKATAEDLRAIVVARFTMKQSLAAIYNDPSATTKTVLLVGGTGFVAKPDQELDNLFALLDDTAGGVAGIHEVDAGPLGGVMKCGSADSPDGEMAVCGWGDYGSLVLALFPGRTVNESAALIIKLRETIQHRS